MDKLIIGSQAHVFCQVIRWTIRAGMRKKPLANIRWFLDLRLYCASGKSGYRLCGSSLWFHSRQMCLMQADSTYMQQSDTTYHDLVFVQTFLSTIIEELERSWFNDFTLSCGSGALNTPSHFFLPSLSWKICLKFLKSFHIVWPLRKCSTPKEFIRSWVVRWFALDEFAASVTIRNRNCPETWFDSVRHTEPWATAI